MIVLTNNNRMGRNLLCLRQKHNLSQKAFSRLVGTDIRSLVAIERGILFKIDAEVLMEVCKLFGINIQVLLEDIMV